MKFAPNLRGVISQNLSAMLALETRCIREGGRQLVRGFHALRRAAKKFGSSGTASQACSRATFTSASHGARAAPSWQ